MAPVGHTWAQKPQPRQVSQSRSFFTGTAGWAGGSGSPGTSTLPAAPEASLSFTPWAKRARTSRSSPSGRPTPRVGAKMWGVMTAAAPTQRKPRASISRFIWARALS